MSIGISILIFFVSIIALVAEFILYFVIGIGTSFSGDINSLTGVAFLFVGLMIITGAIGVLAPICAVIGAISRNKSAGNTILIVMVILVGLFYFIGVPLSALSEKSSENIIVEEKKIDLGQRTEKKRKVVLQKEGIILGEQDLSVVEQKSDNPRTQIEVLEKQKQIVRPEKITEKQLKENYITEFLKIENFKISDGYEEFDTPGYDKPKKGIFGKIKNYGDRTISYLKLRVYFLDYSGDKIYEKEYTVVNTRAIFSFSDDPPIRPNYIKDFGFLIEKDAPSDWGGNVELEICKIDFQKDNE